MRVINTVMSLNVSGLSKCSPVAQSNSEYNQALLIAQLTCVIQNYHPIIGTFFRY